jgi:hypothetical protein
MKFAHGGGYVGEWKRGDWNGHGTLNYADGGVYVGLFKRGNRHGKGNYNGADGRVYAGKYKDDKRHGQGSQTLANGCVYFGEWKDDKRHGKGTYKHPDGHEYSSDDILLASEVVNPECDLSENDQVCIICLDGFCREEERVVLPCSHGFHVCCAYRWLSSKSSCPVCRTPVPQPFVLVPLTPFQIDIFLRALVLNELDTDSD